MYHPAEIDRILDTIKIIVDTREHDIPEARARWESMGCPYVRQYLNFGDYSALCELPDGSVLSLSKKVVIERKMDLDELAACFTREKPRFVSEFKRAALSGAKTYLLIESASWEKAYNHEYRSLMTPNSFVASIATWLARYNCQLIMCEKETSGKLIAEILRYEMREILLNGKY